MDKINIDKRLQQSFPGDKTTIFVQDLYVGFRPKPDRIILLVEVDDVENPGPRVVKLGPPKALDDEWKAWKSCFPHGLRRDLVLMPLEPRYYGEQLISLVYG